jgi:hypothetical protein
MGWKDLVVNAIASPQEENKGQLANPVTSTAS